MKRYWTFAVSQWDRVIGWSCVGGGALLTVLGALSVSRATHELDQLSYLASGPAIGLFLLGVGAILILSADLRDEWRKLDEVVSVLRRSEGAGGDPGDPPSGAVDEISLTETAPAANAENGGTGPDAGRRREAVPLRSGLLAVAVAGIALVIGAAGVNRSAEESSALDWSRLSAASLALVLLVAGFCFLRGRQGIAQNMAGLAGAVAVTTPAAAAAGATGGPGGPCYVIDGSQRYHAPGCELLRFSEARPVPAEDAAAAGLSRCPLC